MNQIPANSNYATTGHKLQGMSKDIIIVSSWPTGGLSLMFKNWEYVVLSRVRTLLGLYLVEPIDMDKSFNPSPQLRSYMERVMQKEKEILEKRRIAMSQIDRNCDVLPKTSNIHSRRTVLLHGGGADDNGKR